MGKDIFDISGDIVSDGSYEFLWADPKDHPEYGPGEYFEKLEKEGWEKMSKIMNIKWMCEKELKGQSEWSPFNYRNQHEKAEIRFIYERLPEMLSRDKRILCYKSIEYDNMEPIMETIIDFIRQDEREKINEEAIIKFKKNLKAARERYEKESTKKEKGIKKR